MRLALSCLVVFSFSACPDSDQQGADAGPDGDTGAADADTGMEADAPPPEDGDSDAPDATDASDAGDTADGEDATPATALVTVVARDKDGLPTEGTTLVIHDAAHDLIGVFTTDPEGRAVVAIPAGGSITSVAGGAGRIGLFTVMGLSDGDVVPMPGGTIYELPSLVPLPDATLAVALAGAFDGAEGYRVLMPCGSGDAANANGEVQVDYRSDCFTGETATDLVAWALSLGGSPLAFASAAAVPLAGPTAALSPWIALGDLSRFVIRLTGAPSGAVLESIGIETRRGAWTTSVPHGLQVVPHFDAEGSYASAHDYDPTFADGVGSHAVVTFALTSELARTFAYDRFDAEPPLEVTVSLDESQWGGASDVDWERSGVNWVANPAGSGSADAMVAELRWRTEGAGGDPVLVTHTLVAPPETTQLLVPTVPRNVMNLPASGSGENLRISVRHTAVTSAAADGFDDYKTRYGALPIPATVPATIIDALARASVTRLLPPPAP